MKRLIITYLFLMILFQISNAHSYFFFTDGTVSCMVNITKIDSNKLLIETIFTNKSTNSIYIPLLGLQTDTSIYESLLFKSNGVAGIEIIPFFNMIWTLDEFIQIKEIKYNEKVRGTSIINANVNDIKKLKVYFAYFLEDSSKGIKLKEYSKKGVFLSDLGSYTRSNGMNIDFQIFSQ